MVDDYGQLYTIEGIAAAVIMLVTAYIMLNTTTLYTPADTHVTDMQLQQLGNDALAMVDTTDLVLALPSPPYTAYEKKLSPLEAVVWANNTTAHSQFNQIFGSYLNSLYSSSGPVNDTRPVQWVSTVYYRNLTSSIGNYSFASSYENNMPGSGNFIKNMTGREHFVTVTRWVHLNRLNGTSPIPTRPADMSTEDQVVLLEVMLWRD